MDTKNLYALVTTSPKSQNAIAQDLGMSQQRFNNYVNGQREPDFDTAIKIAEYFHVSLDYLAGKQAEPPVSVDEMSLVEDYRHFNQEGKERAREFVTAMRRSGMYEAGTDYFMKGFNAEY